MNNFESLNPEIQEHLKQLAKSSGLSAAEDGFERLAAAWLEKKLSSKRAPRITSCPSWPSSPARRSEARSCSPTRARC